jgi:hypothetical protein
MKCPHCGKPVDPNWLHCTYCGREINQADSISDRQDAQGTGSSKVRKLIIIQGIGVLFVVAAVLLKIYWSDPDAQQAAALFTAPWTAAPEPTDIPTNIPTELPTDTPVSVEERARANQSFANGAMVYLYDPQPTTVSRSDLKNTWFSLRYILSDDAKSVSNIIGIYKVDADDAQEFGLMWDGTTIIDWTRETGEITFRLMPESLNDMIDQAYTDSSGNVLQHLNPVYLGIVLLTIDEKDENGKARQLSNGVRIDVTP